MPYAALVTLRKFVRLSILLRPGLLLAATASLASCGHRDSDREIDLVLLVSVDTLRADHLGCYGYDQPTSPTLDRLCATGTSFSEARAHAPSTLLSHASLMTSREPRRHGASHALGLRLPEAAVTLAERFQEGGWRTLALTGGGQLAAEFGLDQGFEIYEELAPDFDLNVDRLSDLLPGGESDPFEPMFVFLHTYEVHHPYTPEPSTLRDLDPDYVGVLPDRIGVDLLQEVNWGGLQLDASDRRHIIAAYDAEIVAVDRALQRLLDLLTERAVADRTLLVVTSDHGEEFGEHGLMGWHATTLHEELLRVPLVFWGAGIGPGVRIGGAASLIDLAPTLLEMVDLPVPGSFEGRSLRPAFEQVPAMTPVHVAMGEIEAAPPFCSIQRGRWKVSPAGLFDLETDPAEQRDLRQERPRIHERLLAALGPCSRAGGSGSPAVLSPATQSQLEALGYLN